MPRSSATRCGSGTRGSAFSTRAAATRRSPARSASRRWRRCSTSALPHQACRHRVPAGVRRDLTQPPPPPVPAPDAVGAVSPRRNRGAGAAASGPCNCPSSAAGAADTSPQRGGGTKSPPPVPAPHAVGGCFAAGETGGQGPRTSGPLSRPFRPPLARRTPPASGEEAPSPPTRYRAPHWCPPPTPC